METTAIRLREGVRDTPLWIFGLALSVLVYGPELTEFTLSIDEEIHGYYGGSDLSRIGRHGRWGLELLRAALPDPGALPFLPTALFCLGLVFSALLLSRLLVQNQGEAFVFVGLFVSSPIWLHIVEFNTISWTIGIALSAMALAATLSVGEGRPAILLSGLLAGFAISVYQGLLSLYALIALVLALRNRSFWESRDTVGGRLLSRFGPAVSFVISVALYYCVNAFALILLKADMSYSRGFVRLEEFRSSFGAAVTRTGSELVEFLIGSGDTFVDWGAVVLFLPWLGFFVGLGKLLDRKDDSVGNRLIDLVTLGFAVLAASIPVLVSAGRAPTRSLVAFPLLYSLMAVNAFRIRFANALKWGVFCLAIYVSLWISATLFYSDNLARQRDSVLAARILGRVEGVGREKFGKSIPTAVVGLWNHEVEGPARRVDIFGESFFEHPEGKNIRIGNTVRIASYLRLQGIEDLKIVPLTQLRGKIDRVNEMPTWPEAGSVALIDDIVVVKLGPPSRAQRRLMTR